MMIHFKIHASFWVFQKVKSEKLQDLLFSHEPTKKIKKEKEGKIIHFKIHTSLLFFPKFESEILRSIDSTKLKIIKIQKETTNTQNFRGYITETSSFKRNYVMTDN